MTRIFFLSRKPFTRSLMLVGFCLFVMLIHRPRYLSPSSTPDLIAPLSTPPAPNAAAFLVFHAIGMTYLFPKSADTPQDQDLGSRDLSQSKKY